MSQENIEIVHEVVDAWNRHDIEGLLALAHPEVQYVNAPSAVEPGTRQGHEAVAAVFRAQWETLPNTRQEIDQVHIRGAEIITVGRFVRQMPDSDARLEGRFVLSWTIREGKVIRGQVLGAGSEFQQALEAAGLSEWFARATK